VERAALAGAVAGHDPQEVIEQEVKLAFASLEAARLAVTTAGGRLVRSRRLQSDVFLDTSDLALTHGRRALRLRREPHAATLTYKGVPEPGPVKSREEIETTVADADALELVFRRLGYAEQWRFEKHREDYALDAAKVFIDDTAAGVFVEIEGTPDVIAATAARLGKTPADYITKSYRSLVAGGDGVPRA
jgi:adenylate cyclase class 2